MRGPSCGSCGRGRGPLATGADGMVIPSYQFTASKGQNIGTLAYWPLNGTQADKSLLGNDLKPGALFACGSTPNNPGYKCRRPAPARAPTTRS
jgi:hypothetical protein